MRKRPFAVGILAEAYGLWRFVMDIIGDGEFLQSLLDKDAWLIAYGPMLVGAALLVWAFRKPQENTVATGNDFSIRTGDISGSGNRVGHDFYKPIPREVDASFAASLTSKIPVRSTVAIEFDSTDADSGVFAQKVQNYLRGQGYVMQDMTAVMTPLPDPGISINLDANPVTIWIGRSA